ncbi:MAG: electron transport complex subunit RsxC [Oscillospiraceae bacterium]|jgi:electron transport complex protein RnfC|nr:electron transport complex subunit RsxC [Oscillospiraceae bacterium]
MAFAYPFGNRRSRKFPGGVHPHGCESSKSLTSGKAFEAAPIPDRLIIPLSQHIGAPCVCLVKAGDTVNLGQMIGETSAFVSAPVHASASGRVLSVAPCMLPNGVSVPSVIIDNDYEDRWDPSIAPDPDVAQREPQVLIARVRAAGIVGMGGAAFPTAVKLTVPQGKSIDTLIINGVECEPYLTVDHRLMLERTGDLIDGAKLAQRIVNAKRLVFGIEANKPDAIAAVRKAAGDKAEVVELPVRYPQGGEKQLIYALTGRSVPLGGLPSAIGAAVLNISTTIEISHALRTGRPLIERGITVSGLVREPKNLTARIGTPLVDLIEYCGGLREETGKIILGGPMMGIALNRLEVPLTKNSSGLLAVGGESIAPDETPCIRCGRCTRSCPMRLQPAIIDAYARKRMWEEVGANGVLNCIECGVCTYVCPAKRQLTQMCRVGKKMAAPFVKRAQGAEPTSKKKA